MKKSLLVLTAISCLMLASCDNQVTISSSIDSSSSISSISEYTSKRLSIASSNMIDVGQYQELDLSSLVVNALYYQNDDIVKTEVVTDYKLINLQTNKEIKQGEVFTVSGIVQVSVQKEGFTPTSLSIRVNQAISITQSLEVISLPNKVNYKIGEEFSSDGLLVNLNTTILDHDNKLVTSTKSISDYKLTILDKEITSYTYQDYGQVRVKITYQGYNKTITSGFSTYCLKDEYVPEDVVTKTLMEEDDTKMKVSISNSSNNLADNDKGYFEPSEINMDYDVHSFAKDSFLQWLYTPSVGDVPLLVVPVVIPGYEDLATQDNYLNIKKAFFGASSDLHFESLHSYYYKSSFGQLDFKATMTDYYYLSSDSTRFNTIDKIEDVNTEQVVPKLAQDAVDWAEKTYNLNLDDYDYDNNGTIDGIWLVYMHPIENNASIYWAFSGYIRGQGSVEEPIVNNYGWISYAFINGEYSNPDEENPDRECDAHIVIHETGHMLGLSDYYDTNQSASLESQDYDAVGSIDIMSSNIGDQNPYSKILLGWIKPYVVYGNCTIDLKSHQSKDQVILIPNDTKTKDSYQKDEDGKYIVNMFDEYLLVEYYTPKEMNSFDYPAYGMKTVQDSGGRIYHVDNRLAVTNQKYQESQPSSKYTATILSNPDECLTSQHKDLLYRVISNTLYEMFTDVTNNKFDEVRWISSDGRKLKKFDSIEDRIFKKGTSFSLDSEIAKEQFVNQNKFDSNLSCSYLITIEDIYSIN